MTKKDGLFIIEGYEKEASLKRKAAQDAVYQCIKENPQIRQVEIAKKLNKHKSNISRDIKKLLRSGYIEELHGYRYSVLPPDNLDNKLSELSELSPPHTQLMKLKQTQNTGRPDRDFVVA
jgi:predicted transcriptional regulator